MAGDDDGMFMTDRKHRAAAMPQQSYLLIKFLPHDAYAWRGLCRGKMSVRLSVRHTLILCLNDYTYPRLEQRHHSSFFRTIRHANIPTGTA